MLSFILVIKQNMHFIIINILNYLMLKCKIEDK